MMGIKGELLTTITTYDLHTNESQIDILQKSFLHKPAPFLPFYFQPHHHMTVLLSPAYVHGPRLQMTSLIGCELMAILVPHRLDLAMTTP